MNKISLNISEYFCEVIIDDQVFFDSFVGSQFWKVYCPDIVVGTSIETYDVRIEISSLFTSFEYGPSTFKIPLLNLSVEDLITVVDFAFEPYRNSIGIYTLNSSSVISGDKAVIFFGGATGMGKTSLARYLSLKPDFNMYSDDKTILNLSSLKVVDGSNFIHKNKTSLQTEFNATDSDHVEFDSETQKNINISLFVYGYTGEKEGFKESEIWDGAKLEWHLYEALTKRIRGVTRRICGGTISLPSLDTATLAEKRIKDLKKVSEEIKCLFIKGEPEFVYNQVLSNINKI